MDGWMDGWINERMNREIIFNQHCKNLSVLKEEK
jgi:hypothetical protein